MQNSTIRSMIIFGVIAIVLGGLAIGGARLIKARNSVYASSSSNQSTASNSADQKQAPASNQQPQKDQNKTETSNNQTKVSSSNNSPQSTDMPVTVPGSSNSQQQVASQPAPNTPQAVPNTSGVALGDFVPTLMLMLLAAFFGVKIYRSRVNFRRYIASQ